LSNSYQARTSAAKLRGQYFTPEALVDLMLAALRLSSRQRVIDPSCGDGSFLRGVIAAAARQFPSEPREALARRWTENLIGFDVDPLAVRDARLRLQAAVREHLGVNVRADGLRVYRADVLAQPSLEALLRSVGEKPIGAREELAVVGNPPYVEAKRLDRDLKAALKERYPDAIDGAPDLYLYFLHVCLGWLREGDRLAFVLPNKLLVNANAQRIRERLLAGPGITDLWLATRQRLFGDAAVYPVVLFARGGTPTGAVATTRLESSNGNGIAPGERIEAPLAAYAATEARAFFPPPEDRVLRGALARLLGYDGGRLGHVLDIRWSVSFHRSGLRERYVTPRRPDSPRTRRFLGGGAFSGNGEVTRYGLEWAGWWIDYDEERLAGEHNHVPGVALFEQPKVVICQNGRTLRAAWDEEGFVLKDTFLCGMVRDRDHPLCRHPRALVGLLCSRAAHFFYSHVFFGGHVNGGYLHFLRQFLVDLPLGRWTDALAGEADAMVRDHSGERYSGVQGFRCSGEGAGSREPEHLNTRTPEYPLRCAELEEEIEAVVSEALGLLPEEQEALRRWAEADENWRLRHRVRRPARDLSAPSAAGG
jgi:hypothetical protein